MKPATHDFDVITDAPPPKRRLPEGAEETPPPSTEEKRSSGQRFAPPGDRLGAAPQQDVRTKPQAAE
jgi:hypothetical protein